jgi:hypothetical protein
MDWKPEGFTGFDGVPCAESLKIEGAPDSRIFTDSPGTVPTKTTETLSEPLSVVFEGAIPGTYQKIECAPELAPAGLRTFRSWAEWQAYSINLLFKELGATGQPGRITVATVRAGQETASRRRGSTSSIRRNERKL